MINVAAMFLLIAAQQGSKLATPEPMVFKMEFKVMNVPNIEGPEVSVTTTEPKVISAPTTKLVTAQNFRTLDSMPALIWVEGPGWNGEKYGSDNLIGVIGTKDGRYELSVDISGTRYEVSVVQRAKVKMKSQEWVQIISKSRKRVMTIKLERVLY